MASKLKVIVLGKNGQLGQALSRLTFSEKYEVCFFGQQDLNLAHPEMISPFLDLHKPDWIINAAAYTAVDKAEDEKELAYLINAEAPKQLALWCQKNNSKLIHYSTDYVFKGEGMKPWTETDMTDPLNYYGQSKRQGEVFVEAVAPEYFIFRTSWVYSPYGKNFLLTMLNLAKERDELRIVSDQIGVPTSADFLAFHAKHVVENSPKLQRGIYHLVPAGELSWFEFAEKIFKKALPLKLIHRTPNLIAVKSGEFITKAQRPMNSRLNTHKYAEALGLTLEPWEAGLDRVLKAVAQEHASRAN